MKITESQFNLLFPKANVKILPYLNRAMARFNIVSPVRTAMFLAQIGHESAGLTVFEENLNYSAEGLANTWPKRYKGADGKPNEMAQALARKPRAIACNVYAGRYGNGDEASCDGWKYRGRGAMQTTFRDNYEALGTALGVELVSQPELLAEPEYAMLAAGFFWSSNGCNELADAGRFNDITKKINGGTNGQEDRRARWDKAKKVLV